MIMLTVQMRGVATTLAKGSPSMRASTRMRSVPRAKNRGVSQEAAGKVPVSGGKVEGRYREVVGRWEKLWEAVGKVRAENRGVSLDAVGKVDGKVEAEGRCHQLGCKEVWGSCWEGVGKGAGKVWGRG